MGRRVRNAVRRIGRAGENIVRGTVDTGLGIIGGIIGQEPDIKEPEVVVSETTTPITQKPTEPEVVTPLGQLEQGKKESTSDTGLDDIESILNSVVTGGDDPFSNLMKKKKDDEEKRKRAVM